jgi:predicted dehydrogenase
MSIGLGIVGSGDMGRTYALCLDGLVQDARLVAVTGGSRAPGLARDFGVEYEPDAETMLRRPDLDAVILASIHSLHMPHTVLAAAQGKHVFVEKPMAPNVAACNAMVEACDSAEVLLAVNKVLRFREAAGTAGRLIRDGAIGEIRMVQAQYVHAGSLVPEKTWLEDPAEGSAFLDWGSHCADLLRWSIGCEAVSASATYAGYSLPGPQRHSAMLRWTFENGAMAQVWYSDELPEPGLEPTDQYLFVGSSGILDLATLSRARIADEAGWRVVAEQPAFRFTPTRENVARLRGFAAQLQDFVTAIQTGGQPAVTGRDGRAAVAMVEAADRAAVASAIIEVTYQP